MQYEPVVQLSGGGVDHVQAHLCLSDATAPAVRHDPDMRSLLPIEEAWSDFAWTLERACIQAMSWSRMGCAIRRVYVALPLVLSQQPGMVRRVERMLADSCVDTRLMGIALSDMAWHEHMDQMHQALRQFKAMGLEVVLDDFGRGFWNPSLLATLPVDMVRISSELIGGIGVSGGRACVAQALMSTAQALCMRVVVKHAQDEQTLRILAREKVPYAMGPCVASPMRDFELTELLHSAKLQCPVTPEGPCRTLLLVDDEANILASLKRLLRRQGYNILTANSGKEGLDRMQEAAVDVIISDQRMPGMTGVDFLRQAKALYPDTMRIVLSGYTELQSITDAINEGSIYKFLTKPWDDELLKAQIDEAFRQKEMQDDNRRLSQRVKDMNAELEKANARLSSLVQEQDAKIERDEAQLLVSHEVLESIPCPMIGLDADGMVAFVNADAEQALGLNVGLVLGEHGAGVLPDSLWALLEQVDSDGLRLEVRGRTFLASARRLPAAGGACGHLLVLLPGQQECEGGDCHAS
ncbi:MAG TPA: EAL domain-containing protein [Aquabacterium sp.]|uniref:EAL domain-containing protein n=1 Tax=Aquabacterium sp. TaxID=1872578 RepID=UPI002E345B34|nr:EAL domain-containing protein [Aquabacterium sp.]HEX5354850.1 EAL domain-containing protein [Aquabacterium sp.]